MAEAASNPFLHHLRHLIGTAPAAGLSDGQLLERFLTDRDETAVEVLVRRYGPLVFGVCRRVLHNAHAAEDVFQAAFLVLMRKAPALDRSRPLGSWLYTVAYRLALNARAQQLRRQRCEARAARRHSAEGPDARPSDVVVALEEELHRLPERHRAPLVLCYLEGKTSEQAAAILGCPRGSMSARLAQARERLRQGLARRGFVAPTAGLAALATTAQASVPLPLLDNTARAAVWFAGEQAGTAGFVSSQAIALARGMLVNKLKAVAAVMLAAAMLGTGATLLLQAAPHAAPQQPPEARLSAAEVPGERLPNGALVRMGSTRLRHGDAVSFAAYTPDGKALLTMGRDRTVRLWDLASGTQVRRFAWGQPALDRKPGLPADEAAQRWEQQFWDATARSTQAALSADGKIVAASRGGVVCLWETATGKKRRDLQTGQQRLLQLAFAADGKSLLTLGPGQATAVWDVATGKCLRRCDSKPAAEAAVDLPGFFEQIAVVSPGLRYLAFQESDKAGGGRSIHIRELATGKDLPPIPTTFATAMAFSPDDKSLVWFRHSNTVVVSDVATGKERRRLNAPNVNIAADLALSADGRRLAVSRASHTVELWDLTTGQQSGRVGTATDVDYVKSNADIVGALVRPALAFSPDGRTLVCSLGGAALRQFHADTGEEISGPATGPRAAASSLNLSADGKSLCTHGHGEPLRFWDWATGKQTGQRRLPRSATQAVFAADGRFAFADGAMVTLCGADGEKRSQIAVGGPRLMALALSPDGALLATRSGSPREVHLWDTVTGKERHVLAGAGAGPEVPRGVLAETTGVVPPDVVFSPDGRRLAGAGPRRQLCLWDTATGTLLWEVTPPAGEAIERFAFSPSGHCLATVNADQSVTLYETLTGAQRGRLGQPDPKNRRIDLTGLSAFSYLGWRQDAPVCLAFSPDGRYLATARDTPQIHLWDVLAGRELGLLQGHEGGVVSLLFTPDGKHLISGSSDTTALTWDLTRLIQPRAASGPELQPQALAALWTDLASKDAALAFAALRQLCACHAQAIPLLGERVHPASGADAKRLARLLANLQSDRFEERRQAEAELEELGERAEPALRQALAGDPPLDLRKRLERLLDNLGGPVHRAGQLRDLRAVEVLELIGTSEARQVLQTLAGGVPTARLTREAGSALQRLLRVAGHKPQAPARG
jgi:RNA polymerase sigma factor (sigma-70 family)